MVDRLTRRSQQIADYPLSGRCVPEYNMGRIREVIEGPYRIIYHITVSRIDILAVQTFRVRSDLSVKIAFRVQAYICVTCSAG